MKRILLSLMSMVLVASLAHAQSEVGGQATGQATSQPNGTVQSNPADASTNATVTTEASAEAKTTFQQRRDAIERKGSYVSAKARSSAEAKLDATAKRTDQEATQDEEKVASRLATEFGMTTDALIAEKNDLGTSWGQLMIIHTLTANSSTGMTTQQFLDMHQDGMGWGQIAAGLGLKLGEVVSAVNSEGRVASGLAKADGKVAAIHGANATAGLGAHAGSQGSREKVGANVGAETGAKVKP